MRKPLLSAAAQTGEVYMQSSVLCSEVLPGGATWSHVLKRGTALRITDTDGDANVAAYFLNFENPSERFNLPDTLKAQHTARLRAGHVLFSDMGRVLCSITEDSVGWHDPIAGISNASSIERKYGKAERISRCATAGIKTRATASWLSWASTAWARATCMRQSISSARLLSMRTAICNMLGTTRSQGKLY
jgi:uncharacterized protein YcgI (DUF1989 family)